MMHKKHIWIIVLFILLGIAAFVLAGGSDDDDTKEVNLYFLDKNGYAMTAVETEISAKNDAELYEKVATALIAGPSKKDYLPIMDKGVSLNYVTIGEEGNLTVDFSGEYPEDNLMCTYAVIKTFSRLVGVKSIQVTENGNQIFGIDGIPLGFVTGDAINTESDEDTATGVRLYFANSKMDELVMEYRKINIVDTRPVEQYVVTELIKGPKIKGNERLLASDTKVLSVATTDGICYVNFKKGFIEKNMASSGGGKLLIDSVVKSLTGLKNVNSVQFLVDGKKTETFGETDISGLFVKEEPQASIAPEGPQETEAPEETAKEENTVE